MSQSPPENETSRDTADDLPTGRGFLSAVLAVASVFLFDSLVRVPVPGVNEPHYLTKARAFADPAWCPGDFFLESANAHTVFYAVAGPLTQWFSFEAVAIIGRIVSLLLLATGWVMIARRLHLSGLAATVTAAVFCLIAMTGNFSGEWVVGGFESKVPAYAFSLIAIAIWLDARLRISAKTYALAGVFSGLAAAFHPVVGIWFCIGIAGAELLGCIARSSRLPARSVPTFLGHGVCYAGTAFVVALPGLLPALLMLLSSDVEQDQNDRANLIQIFWRLAHHLDPMKFPAAAWIHAGVLLGILSVSCGWLWWLNRSQPGRSEDKPGHLHHDQLAVRWRLLNLVLVMSLLIAIAGVAVGFRSGSADEMTGWQIRATLLKFYPFRFFDGYVQILTAFAIVAVAARVMRRQTEWLAVIGTVAVLGMIAASVCLRPAAPRAFTSNTYSDWIETCHWLQHNTPPDALVYGPRESFGLKWFAERPEYVCYKDCPQDAAGILEWNRRLWAIHHWSERAFRDEVFDPVDLQNLREQTGIDYLVTRRLGPFNQQPVYSNSTWRVYRTTP